jgi:uncharacterized phage-associated protein
MHVTSGEVKTVGAPPYPAMTIAKWFVAWAQAQPEELSNMKLQKLLYFAQGHYLARHHAPLFAEPMQAWSHGPVVPRVYRAYKHFGSSTVELDDAADFSWDDVDPATSEFLSMVWNTYGGYSAGRLRNMTHEDGPWRTSWRGEDERDVPISQDAMERYFGQLETAG